MDIRGLTNQRHCVADARILDLHALSSGALKLHVCAVLVTIDTDHAGQIPDRYLGGLPDAALNVWELCLAGAWTRVDQGYRVREDEVARIERIVHDPPAGLGARPSSN